MVQLLVLLAKNCVGTNKRKKEKEEKKEYKNQIIQTQVWGQETMSWNVAQLNALCGGCVGGKQQQTHTLK